MVRLKYLAFIAAAVFAVFSTAYAETLVIENIDISSAALAERPNRGMSMNTVASKWGEPDIRLSAVGDPPIARWEYPDFVVYFEYDHVIHAVANH